MPSVRTATLVALLTLAPGCKWLSGDKGSATPPTGSPPDPLMGMRRIDPQSGVLRRDPVVKGESDPLTYQPASRGRGDDLPPRKTSDQSQRAPYRPSAGDSPAALAGGSFDSDLEINRGDTAPSGSFDEVARLLRAAGATVGKPTSTGEGWTVGATVPIGGEPPGSRRFMGRGPTPAAAAESALDQVRARAN